MCEYDTIEGGDEWGGTISVPGPRTCEHFIKDVFGFD